MKRIVQVAPGVWRLSQRAGPLINAYWAEGVLIDAGRRQDAGDILRHLEGRELVELALTHAHPDHQGAATAVCEARGVPLACHADDVDAMEGRRPMSASSSAWSRLVDRMWGGPPRAVDRVLRDGDEVAGFRVVHAPGHSPGEIVLYRERDGLAICGDVVRSISYLTGRPGVRLPPDGFNADTEQNRRSVGTLAGLEPSRILPGHGPAITDMAAFHRFAAAVAPAPA